MIFIILFLLSFDYSLLYLKIIYLLTDHIIYCNIIYIYTVTTIPFIYFIPVTRFNSVLLQLSNNISKFSQQINIILVNLFDCTYLFSSYFIWLPALRLFAILEIIKTVNWLKSHENLGHKTLQLPQNILQTSFITALILIFLF